MVLKKRGEWYNLKPFLVDLLIFATWEAKCQLNLALEIQTSMSMMFACISHHGKRFYMKAQIEFHVVYRWTSLGTFVLQTKWNEEQLDEEQFFNNAVIID